VLNAKDYEVPQKRERIFIVGIRSDLAAPFTYPEKSKKAVVLRDVLVYVPASIGAKYTEEKAAVMAHVPPGGCWVDLPVAMAAAYMGAKSLEAGGGKRGMARRLSMDEACLTLTTSPCQKQTERCHPKETRPLTVREYARIQTFPDTYSFSGGMANQYKQIGNAVPVKLALAMGKQIKAYLEHK
jgi:DNA (cytosine-5)-methyltransferase 1